MLLIRFAIPHALVALCAASLYAGYWWPWVFFIGLSALVTLGDRLCPQDRADLREADPRVADALLWIVLPALIILLLLAVFSIAIGAQHAPEWILRNWTAYAHRWDYASLQLLGVVLSVGLLIGGVGTSAAHECMHRPRAHWLRTVGDWLMALSMDSVFPIEHNHGHHRHVGTLDDAATARRGESVYRFIVRSTWGEYGNAWRIERQRLDKLNRSPWSPHNRYLRALARSAVFPLLAASVGGALCAVVVLLAMLWAKVLLETVNYIEHYGLVRVPNAPIEPRHSWNSSAWMSGTITFLLTRHSHHHQQGSLPFWRLRDMPDAPLLPWGYLSAIYRALLQPTRYRDDMEPHLCDWFDRYASPQERQMAAWADAGRQAH